MRPDGGMHAAIFEGEDTVATRVWRGCGCPHPALRDGMGHPTKVVIWGVGRRGWEATDARLPDLRPGF